MSRVRHLVIFAKAPRLGRVKTRLGRDIGMVRAWGFYRHALVRLARTLAHDRRWQTVIAAAPDTALMDPVWPEGVPRIAQGAGDLGQRMQRTFDTFPDGPVVIVGADIPGITPELIADAFHALGNHDTVFGPAADGGYWLVGQKRAPKILRLFSGVRWSGPHALEDTKRNLEKSTFFALKTLNDVDNGADFRRIFGKET